MMVAYRSLDRQMMRVKEPSVNTIGIAVELEWDQASSESLR